MLVTEGGLEMSGMRREKKTGDIVRRDLGWKRLMMMMIDMLEMAGHVV
jgi:hypothetical protein